jgi:hypothetical protein
VVIQSGASIPTLALLPFDEATSLPGKICWRSFFPTRTTVVCNFSGLFLPHRLIRHPALRCHQQSYSISIGVLVDRNASLHTARTIISAVIQSMLSMSYPLTACLPCCYHRPQQTKRGHAISAVGYLPRYSIRFSLFVSSSTSPFILSQPRQLTPWTRPSSAP